MNDDDAFIHEMSDSLRNLDRDHLALDDVTAERLIGAALSTDDAPPAYRRVAEALALLTAPATAAELGDEQRAVASIVAHLAVMSGEPIGRTKMTRRRLVQLSLASVVGGVTLLGGLAGANALPGAAQGVASDVLGRVGISVPNPNDDAGDHPDQRGDSSPTDTTAPPAPTTPTSTPESHGSEVSNVARTTPPGDGHGSAVSDVASDGRSHAGGDAGTEPASTPPVTVPSGGGTDTADTASDGHSSTGTSTADTASDGHSSEGSGNATNRP